MRKFGVKPVIEAVQITDATFAGTDPNPEHIPGVMYDSRERCAFIPIPGGTIRADIGHWIIRDDKGQLASVSDQLFQASHAREETR